MPVDSTVCELLKSLVNGDETAFDPLFDRLMEVGDPRLGELNCWLYSSTIEDMLPIRKMFAREFLHIEGKIVEHKLRPPPPEPKPQEHAQIGYPDYSLGIDGGRFLSLPATGSWTAKLSSDSIAHDYLPERVLAGSGIRIRSGSNGHILVEVDENYFEALIQKAVQNADQ